MSLTPRQIENIANLARLELKSEEIPLYVESLSSIVALVGQLENADTTGIEPMAHPLTGQSQRLRPDEPARDPQRDLYQRNAPQTEAGLYLVPRVIE